MALKRRPVVEAKIGPETPVQICQLEDEFTAALDLYCRARPRRVLEIGTAAGGTLYHWLQHAAPGAVVVSVDLPVPDYELDRELVGSWVADDVTLHLIQGDSHDPRVIDEIRGLGPFGWVFIDGNHRYQHVAADLSAYWPMLTPTGYLLLHDICLKRVYEDGDEAGVGKVWAELREAGFWTRELRADPDGEAYGIGVIYGKETNMPITTEDLQVFSETTPAEPEPAEPEPDDEGDDSE